MPILRRDLGGGKRATVPSFVVLVRILNPQYDWATTAAIKYFVLNHYTTVYTAYIFIYKFASGK